LAPPAAAPNGFAGELYVSQNTKTTTYSLNLFVSHDANIIHTGLNKFVRRHKAIVIPIFPETKFNQMPKMRVQDWNSFITTHPTAVIFGAVVSSRLPPALAFDKNARKLPTPYKLFCEWLEASLTGQWSSLAVPNGFVIGIVDETDKRVVLGAYGPARFKGFKIGDKSVAVLTYMDGKYAKLAEERGYELNI
jgi:hypothetical protein